MEGSLTVGGDLLVEHHHVPKRRHLPPPAEPKPRPSPWSPATSLLAMERHLITETSGSSIPRQRQCHRHFWPMEDSMDNGGLEVQNGGEVLCLWFLIPEPNQPQPLDSDDLTTSESIFTLHSDPVLIGMGNRGYGFNKSYESK